MLSFDDRSRNAFNPISSQEPGQATPFTEPLTQNDGLAPFSPTSTSTNILPDQSPSYLPMVMDPQTPLPESNFTHMLSGALGGSGNVHRPPVIIRGNLKRPEPAVPPHPRRRKITSLVGIFVLFVIVSISLLITTPLGQTVGLNTNPPASNMQVIGSRNSNNTLGSIVAQATATAVYNNQQADGYDPYANSGGGVSVGAGNSPRPWPYGQCTYWANAYYHQLTGWWVNWAGNADQWVAGASAAGWNVSTTPHVYSIMVLMPGVQGASYAYGHVAVVTSIINSYTVMTSNMNWWANGGGWGIVSNVEFNYGPGYGVYFLWHS